MEVMQRAVAAAVATHEEMNDQLEADKIGKSGRAATTGAATTTTNFL